MTSSARPPVLVTSTLSWGVPSVFRAGVRDVMVKSAGFPLQGPTEAYADPVDFGDAVRSRGCCTNTPTSWVPNGEFRQSVLAPADHSSDIRGVRNSMITDWGPVPVLALRRLHQPTWSECR